MKPHWIDAGVLIQAERGPYPRKIVPQFWSFLEQQLATGAIRMPRRAWKEVVDGGYTDELQVWCRNRKGTHLCCNETEDVQERYRIIAAHVWETDAAKPHLVNEFLSGADGWIIAHAMATNGIVVTQELARSAKGKIKIPTVAKALDVRCINTRQMLDALKADFSKGV